MNDLETDKDAALGGNRGLNRIRATIDLNDGIGCEVVKLSDQKATIELAVPVDLPGEFRIAIEGETNKRYCAILWRRYRRAGVLFV